MCTQDDDGWRLSEQTQARHDLESVQSRHFDIEDKDIGVMQDAKMKSLEAIGGLGHDRQAGDFEEPAQAPSDDGMIVSHENSHSTPP
jgi:hypothetical protein